MDGLVPPPRFGTTTFGAYTPIDPSQELARDRVAAFAATAGAPAGGSRFAFRWRRRGEGHGLYLDGGFGVGKTHLLAAAWHASPLPASMKRYLSFQELVYLLGVLGRDGAREAFAGVKLVCLDEFELDDPGNTLLIATFLREAFARGTSVITTSNTPPEAQGAGRFAAKDFQREIQAIADRFEVVTIDGPDHRAGVGRADWCPPAELAQAAEQVTGVVRAASYGELLRTLERYHPTRYRELLHHVDLLIVERMRPIADQNAALRFVHFIDKLYDLGTAFRASGLAPLNETFDPSYRDGAYLTKHHRCLSRLSELLDEPLAPRTG